MLFPFPAQSAPSFIENGTDEFRIYSTDGTTTAHFGRIQDARGVESARGIIIDDGDRS